MDDTKVKRIEFLSSAFKMNHQVGSNDSIKWLQCLKEAENSDIFLSNLKILVDYKWEKVKHLVILDAFFNILYAFLLGVDAIAFNDITSERFKYAKIVMTAYTCR